MTDGAFVFWSEADGVFKLVQYKFDYTETILQFVAAPSKRADVVPMYAHAILMQRFARPPLSETNWSRVNHAIADRWSWAAVKWIKEKAWKRAEAIASGKPVGEREPHS